MESGSPDSSVLTGYLEELCEKCSQGKLEIRQSPLGGLGVFARVDFLQGDVICTVPRNMILSGLSPTVHLDERIQQLIKDRRINVETFLFAYMSWNRKTNPYLASLPPSLTLLDPDELAGTNVSSQILKDRQHMAEQYRLIDGMLQSSPGITLAELLHAKTVYNSRRYPIKFSLVEGGLIEKREAREEDPPSKKRRHYEPRAVNDPTQGCLCPILDLLNHQRAAQPHLSFKITEDSLIAINERSIVKAGEEIFHNYDCANNDQYLLQFGFCETDQDDLDVFAVQLGNGRRFELRGHEPIPEELLGDGGQGLGHHLLTKLSTLATVQPSGNPHVQAYMKAQAEVIQQLLAQIQEPSEDEGLSDTEEATKATETN